MKALLEWLQKITWERIAIVLAAIILIQSILEKVFGVSIIGKKIYKGAPQLWKWIMKTATFRKDMDNKLNEILGEVKYNTGTSLKDAMHRIETKQNLQIDEIRETKSAVDMNTFRLDLIDTKSNQMIFYLDNKGACTSINNTFLKFFGYTEQDIENFNWEHVIHEEDIEEVKTKWARAIKQRSKYVNTQRIIKADGTDVLCKVNGYPIIEGGELTEFYGTVELISEEIKK